MNHSMRLLAVLAAAASLTAVGAVAQPAPAAIFIRNALVIDGRGTPGVRGARPCRDSEEVRGPHSHLRPTSRELRLEEAKQKSV